MHFHPQLARLAFLSVKDAREVIARLSSHNFIEPQEVSRSADRAPSRTFFLWFVDYSRVITSLLSHHYKALANLQVQRAKVLQDNAALLIKSDKTDSSGCKIPLTVKEQDQKALMKDVLLALATAEARIDRDVFILSELDPKA
jgi:DNA-directed RNA polymerase III subunit RPC3